MKLSINTSSTFVFLFFGSVATGASSSPVKDNKETAADIVSSITKIALPNAFQRHLQISQHKDLILKKKRQLQAEPTACDQAYTDLYLNNAALAAASETYSANYLAALETANIDTSCTMSEDFLTIDCDFRQSTILGQQEFESACTDLGAKVIALTMDINCDMNTDGISSSLGMQFNEAVDCIPADCEEEGQTALVEAVTELENQLESAFLASGVTSVECTA